ncbi:MAG: rod shape-determining protein MreD [Lachnospira sp.]|nr:rod shape-determining protein MreD [Lachnospira sp.]
MKRKVGELILILCFYLFQVSLGRVIAIAGIVPNFLIILPVLFGFFKGKNEGMFVGFFAGMMYDLFFSGLFGFSSLIFIYVGYFAGFFYQKYEEREILIPMSMILIADFGFAFLSYVGNFLLHNRLNVGFFMSRFILPEVVYTLIISVIVYKPILFLSNRLDIVRSRRRIKEIYERNH